jgi:hypothetical protein
MISCADAMEASLLARKANNNPAVCSLQGDKLTKCVAAVVEKLKATPCQDIQEAYLACLDGKMTKTGNLVKCRPLADQLEDCTAKHVGRLD